MKYAHYNVVTKQLLGWYDTDIHSEIPNPNIKVTNEEWEQAMSINANMVDTETMSVIVGDLRTEEEKLQDAKTARLILTAAEITQEMVIGVNTFSSQREDIQKYKEATDIAESLGADVNLFTDKKKITLSIIDAREVILGLSQKAYNDYWIYKDMELLVNSKTTIEEVNSL